MNVGLNWFSRGERVLSQSEMLVKQQANDLANLLRVQAMTSTDVGVEPNSDRNVIISLTTFDKRIDDVYLCIESLLQQSLRPNRIVLWLSDEEFPDHAVPASLQRQMPRGLEVRFCPRDIGPYKKIIPSLAAFPESLIVTVDDDVMYPVDMLDKLYRTHLANPKVVVANRAHLVAFDGGGGVAGYKDWQAGTTESGPSARVFPVGVGGVLYFPGCFDPEVMNEEAFMRLAPGADDVWLKAMALKAGVKALAVTEHRHWRGRYLFIEGSQKFSLKRQNKSRQSGNDVKIRAVLDAYGLEPLFRD